MKDYCDDCLALYCDYTGCEKFKKVTTSFCPEGSLVAADEEVKGQLSDQSCNLLMKALWVARLARPACSKAIGDLTTKVTKWSKNDDKRLFRLFCYILTS